MKLFALNIFTAIITILAGYLIALCPRSKLNITTLKYLMALGAGFLLTIVFVELLPLALKNSGGDYSNTFFYTLMGIVTVFFFDRWIAPRLTFWDPRHADDGCAHHHEYAHDQGHQHVPVTDPTHSVPRVARLSADHQHAACGHAIIAHGAACSAVGCLIVCSFFDGIAFSGGLVQNTSLGALIFVGQLLHVVPEGLLASGLILAARGTADSAKRAAIITGSMFLAGALIPSLITLGVSQTHTLTALQNFFLSLSSGILLYVGLTQLVPASSASKIESALVLAGGAVFGILHTVIGH